jgi:hypothetical protein
MANANSSATTLRPSKDAILRTLERLETDRSTAASSHGAVRATASSSDRARRASGVYSFVAPLLRTDDYAGLERLDRAELDETDEG